MIDARFLCGQNHYLCYKRLKIMTNNGETYNEAVAKLRRIVTDIEKGELDVDILSEKVKEATRLIKLCKEKLFKVDEEVKKVLEELE